MKIDIGCGFKKLKGFTRIDSDPEVFPDYVIDLDDKNLILPFDDNTVEEIHAEHILEHIGDGFFNLMQELYRVAEHGCIFTIIGPNENHAVFWGDPTHKRVINTNVMYMFSKKFCLDHIKEHNSSRGFALKLDVDFEVIDYSFEYDQFYVGMLNDFFERKEQGNVTPEEDFGVQRLLREANNVCINNHIKMIVNKGI